ncbi:MAG: 5-(carboxyamino)imidazole ribonucleotide synthase [Bacteroidota bacterium]|nr:5-(carboxyamino)imidazole ribonucleotide synthase [Bacteroidota bacterium]
MAEVLYNNQPAIGIVGGGQLGCMFVQEAARYDIIINTLDADNAPAKTCARNHIVGSLQSADDINLLAQISDVLTFEIENINVEALIALEKSGKKIIPSPRVLQLIQDKAKQKFFYLEHRIPTAPFVVVDDIHQIASAIEELKVADKFVIKTATGGYDGKGVFVLSKNSDYINQISMLSGKLVVEIFIDDAIEVAVIAACDQQGNIKCFPAVEMVFDPKLNLVDTLICPARIEKSILERAEEIAISLINQFESPGLFAVEMFVTPAGDIYINETAPRPHNSGHHTIEGCFTSQYEQLLRVLMGWPLGSSDIIKPSSMINIIGPADIVGNYYLQNMDALLLEEGVYIHLYGKHETRPGRKLGHITILAETIEDLIVKTEKVKLLYTVAAA